MRRRILVVASLAVIGWATIVYVTGGVGGDLAGVRISSRSFVRPLILGILLLGFGVFIYGWRSLDADVEWLIGMLRPATAPIVVAVSVAILCLGLFRGIVTAAGADGYGYVSQADLWLRHELRIEQPFVEKMPLPFPDWSFSPLGYRPVPGAHAIVPTYAPGLPILMAAFKAIAGPRGPYLVVPILGGLLVWLCYRLGVRAGSPLAGVTSALLLASSPVFLFQLMWPMSDIPAAAFWTAALAAALGQGKYSPAIAGACAAVAVVIRPNLAPLAAIPLGILVWTRRGWLAFALALVPGVCLAAAVNAYLYGSPLASGYGTFDSLFKLSHAPANVKRYTSWLLLTETPLVALALVALAKPPRAIRWWLAAFVAGNFIAYMFYAPFDDWWYLRFLLPALPALLILMAVGLIWLVSRFPPLPRAVAFACSVMLLMGYGANFVASRGVFGLREGEQRYETVGRYVASATPPNAVFLSMQHSGSLRYYGGRLTMRYDWVPGDWLDRAIAMLRAQGYRPYIVLEEWEEEAFRKRFSGQSEAGRLAWLPLIEFKSGMPVRVYEPP
jgi:hypothetical protein